MSKVTFSSLKLKNNDEVKTITVAGKEIEVRQYLPAEDKSAILDFAMQAADDATILNPFALDTIFNVYVVMKYTNITFTDTQREDLFKLYDILESNNIINEVINAIPSIEYESLVGYLKEMKSDYAVYRNSARGLVDGILAFAPSAATSISEQLKDFDVSKLQNIISIAEATGYRE